MHIVKCFWAMRAVIYKLSFRHVGNMTYIGKPLYLSGRNKMSIGSYTRIFPGVRMEAIDKGTISIGDNVAIEQNLHIISKDGDLKIGNNVTIAPNVFISNVNHKYENISKSVMNQGYEHKETIIGEGCFIGYGAVIQPGTILGKHCIVGANAAVKGNFGDYEVIVGVPGKCIKKYDIRKGKWEKIDE